MGAAMTHVTGAQVDASRARVTVITRFAVICVMRELRCSEVAYIRRSLEARWGVARAA